MPGTTPQNKDVNQAKLLPESMSGSLAQLKMGFALNSVAQVVTGAHAKAWDLGQSLTLGWSQRGHITAEAIQIWAPIARVSPEPRLPIKESRLGLWPCSSQGPD